MRQTVGSHDYAVPIRGEDRFHHFVNPPLPTTEFADDALAMVRDIDANATSFLYATAEQKGQRDAVEAPPTPPSG